MEYFNKVTRQFLKLEEGEQLALTRGCYYRIGFEKNDDGTSSPKISEFYNNGDIISSRPTDICDKNGYIIYEYDIVEFLDDEYPDDSILCLIYFQNTEFYAYDFTTSTSAPLTSYLIDGISVQVIHNYLLLKKEFNNPKNCKIVDITEFDNIKRGLNTRNYITDEQILKLRVKQVRNITTHPRPDLLTFLSKY